MVDLFSVLSIQITINIGRQVCDSVSVVAITSAKINFLTERLTVETELTEAEALAVLRKTAADFEDGIEIK